MKLIGHAGLTTIVLAAVVAFGSVRASAQTESSPPEAFAPYVEMIRELDLRRRVNVLYPNPQSLFDGLQVGFVNTTTGNLTFRRRDIVTRAQGPVVFARVYDSRIGTNADFGSGWRISLAEELLVDADTVTYVDEAGARHTFASTGKVYAASPSTPRHAATTLSFADADGTRIATLVDGDTTRTFERADDAGTRYVVKTVKTGSRELVFDYYDGRLKTVSYDDETLFHLHRDADGRVSEVHDDHDRSVRYTYDTRTGRLATVRDIAGHDWRYLYRQGGQLSGAAGPNNQPYLAVAYDAEGRVTESFSGRLYSYAYADGSTTVTEGTGAVHTFTRNAAGVVTALSSTSGVSWNVALDTANRVTTLTLPDRTLAYRYGTHGKVATVGETVSETTTTRSYVYDGQGRLSGVSGGEHDTTVTYATGHVRISEGGEVFEYRFDQGHRVTSVQRGTEATVRVVRDASGDVTTVSQGEHAVQFSRDELGRIVDTTYPAGHGTRYFYDELGNRRVAEYAHGGSVAYTHDAAGNIIGVVVIDLDGTVRRQTMTVGTGNRIGRVVYEGAATLDVDYDKMGRPVEFDTGTETITVEYGSIGAITKMSAESNGATWVPDAEYQVSAKPVADGRLTLLQGDRPVRQQPDYGVVELTGETEATERDPLHADVPYWRDAHELLKVAAPLLGDRSEEGFEKPSNPVFQPAEYVATNCCMPWDGEFCGPSHYGGGGGGSAAFEATASEVDACMRGASSDVSSVTPHEIRYGDISGLGQAARQGNLYITTLDIDAITSDAQTSQRSTRDVIHEVLAHEYVHHLYPDLAHGSLFDSRARRIERATRNCD